MWLGSPKASKKGRAEMLSTVEVATAVIAVIAVVSVIRSLWLMFR